MFTITGASTVGHLRHDGLRRLQQRSRRQHPGRDRLGAERAAGARDRRQRDLGRRHRRPRPADGRHLADRRQHRAGLRRRRSPTAPRTTPSTRRSRTRRWPRTSPPRAPACSRSATPRRRSSTSTIGRNTGEGCTCVNPQPATADGVIVAANTVAALRRQPVHLGVGGASPTGRPAASRCRRVDPQLSVDLVAFYGAADHERADDPGLEPGGRHRRSRASTRSISASQPRYSAALAPCDAGAYEESASGAGGEFPAAARRRRSRPSARRRCPRRRPRPMPAAAASASSRSAARSSLPAARALPAAAGGRDDPDRARPSTRARAASRSRPERGSADGEFYDGLFRITPTGGLAELALTEKLAPCSSRARAAQKKPKSRKLWGDGKGKFRTKGRYAAATVRGTRWLTQDTCAGTLVRVTQGVGERARQRAAQDRDRAQGQALPRPAAALIPDHWRLRGRFEAG